MVFLGQFYITYIDIAFSRKKKETEDQWRNNRKPRPVMVLRSMEKQQKTQLLAVEKIGHVDASSHHVVSLSSSSCCRRRRVKPLILIFISDFNILALISL